ncbi:MAG: VOC family protein [Propionibacteriales bacterium]|nr:VOC family protein [Propionibacteriales bacterium]
MPLVSWKDLCIDVLDPATSGPFWASVLGLRVVPDGAGTDDVHLEGDTPGHTVWLCRVPEPKTVKDRVHLDVHAAEEVPPGTTRISPEGAFRWTVVAGPEGDELCTFVREEVPEYRLYEVAVDGADHRAAAAWWQVLWGGRVGTDAEGGFSWVEDVPGLPCEAVVFCSVPEPKTVKNRIHWDVTLEEGVEVDHLVELGATVLRRPDDEIVWTVMADPDGNEFCVFERADA